MSPTLLIDDEGVERRFEGDELELSLGGEGSDLRLPGARGEGPLVYLGFSEGELFVQPAAGAESLVCNGRPLASSQWLRHGDVLVLSGTRLFFEERGDELRLIVRERAGEVASPPLAPGEAAGGEPPRLRPAPFEPVSLGARRRRPLLPGLAAAGVFALVAAALAGAAWYVVTARGVRVEIQPPPDRARFESGLWTPRWGDRYLLRPGSHRLVAEKEGYRRLEETVVVTRDSSAELQFRMEPLPVRLSISVEPAVGVRVAVDGAPVGTTPLAPLELEPGTYRVALSAPGFRDFAAEITLPEAGASRELRARLEDIRAAVSFVSEPEGATVELDGEVVGASPLTLKVEEGSHRAVWLLAGYEPASRRFEVRAAEPATVSVRLAPAAGNLLLRSLPEDASVRVDGDYRGQTPLDLELEPGREHEIRLSKAGHESVSERVRLPSGESRLLEIRLPPRLAEVTVTSRPPNAEVLVDGEPRGSTGAEGLRLSLPTGASRRIEVRKEGYESYFVALKPRAELEQSIDAVLVTPREAEEARTPPILSHPRGHLLVLVRGGSFRMGAPRREPGRRANEAQREVELTRPFYLATREVSNEQFRDFRKAHRSGKVGSLNLEIDHHPAVRVSWDDAARYCNWLSAQESLPAAYVERGGRMVAVTPMSTGYRLPTEAEWAWVARHPDGGGARKYAWGDALPVEPGSGNFGGVESAADLGAALPGYRDGYPATAPVDSFAPDPGGFFHLGGNVAEWMHDVYAERPGGAGVERDPAATGDSRLHVVRGASWMTTAVTALRLTYRDSGSDGRPDVGFRIARYAE